MEEENYSAGKLFDKHFESLLSTSPASKNAYSSESSPEPNPFAFSFNGAKQLSPEFSNNTRKCNFGLNLLKSFYTRYLAKAFGAIGSFEKGAPCLKKLVNLIYLKKLKNNFRRWHVKSIQVHSQEQVSSALTMVDKMNSFSRHYISCSIITSIFQKKYMMFAQKFFCESKPNIITTDDSLIPKDKQLQWCLRGLLQLQTTCVKKQLKLKKGFFSQFAQKDSNTQEQLFLAKEAKEKAEFEKEELSALLESKTEELTKVLDMLEDCKNIKHQGPSNQELQNWKHQALQAQQELHEKTQELFKSLGDKKKAEEESLKAYRAIEVVQKEYLELQKKASCDKCQELPKLKEDLTEARKKIKQLKDTKSQYAEQINNLQEQLSKLQNKAKTLKPKPKLPQRVPKKNLSLEKPPTDNDYAADVINLNRQLNQLKHDHRNLSDNFRKCQAERDELKKSMQAKNETLERLRKENDQLSISLSTDHHKSVRNLENQLQKLTEKYQETKEQTSTLQQDNKELSCKLNLYKQELQKLSQQYEESAKKEYEESQTVQENAKILENLSSLQSQFNRLKEYSEKQITAIENLKQENFQLTSEIENYKSIARSAKLHADKAASDANSYSGLVTQLQTKLSQETQEKEQTLKELQDLKNRFIKLINT